ncbi:MAG: hypothetical protein M3P93_11670 [Actinomycetota bacterium]|jgi:hypothetical protein|nr:hypothetical protein [Actinomycetota bacterium]
MSEQPDHELEPVAADPDAQPRPEEEVAGVRDAGAPSSGGRSGQEFTRAPAAGLTEDPADQPVAGGSDDGPPAQGEGAADSW